LACLQPEKMPITEDAIGLEVDGTLYYHRLGLDYERALFTAMITQRLTEQRWDYIHVVDFEKLMSSLKQRLLHKRMLLKSNIQLSREQFSIRGY
jgi:hypothetical protein